MRIILFLLVAISMFAQEPQAGKKKGPPQPPKNLKLLKPEEVRGAMGAFRIALGSNCQMCHVQGDFASDEKPEKETARKMIAMTREINAKFPDGKEHVTCFTCHRGDHQPKTQPDAAPAAAN
jgi:Photosynthetic reaction centre cytochrome C subunit